MRDDERFEIERAYDLLPHVIGASLACVWFRTNNIKKPSEDEFRKKTVEFFSTLSNIDSSYPNEEKFSEIRTDMKNRYNQDIEKIILGKNPDIVKIYNRSVDYG